MNKPYVVDSKEHLKREVVVFSLGLITGMFLLLLALDYKEASADEVVSKACRLPDINGAMTVFVMENDKLKCWRWK